MFVPLLVGGGVLLGWLWGWAMLQVASSWVEIDGDACAGGAAGGGGTEWSLGPGSRRPGASETRRVDLGRGIVQLRFHDAAGKRVGVLPLFQFDRGRVLGALRRHGWPDPVEWR